MLKMLFFMFFILFITSCSNLNINNIECSNDENCPKDTACLNDHCELKINLECIKNSDCKDNEICNKDKNCEEKIIKCTNGEKRCYLNNIQECKSEEWIDIEICSTKDCKQVENSEIYTCVDDTCRQNEKKCDFFKENILICNENKWVLAQSCNESSKCESSANDVICKSDIICTPNSSRCDLNILKTCSEDGKVEEEYNCKDDDETCEVSDHLNASCKLICTSGQTRCNENNEIEKCRVNGWETEEICSNLKTCTNINDTESICKCQQGYIGADCELCDDNYVKSYYNPNECLEILDQSECFSCTGDNKQCIRRIESEESFCQCNTGYVGSNCDNCDAELGYGIDENNKCIIKDCEPTCDQNKHCIVDAIGNTMCVPNFSCDDMDCGVNGECIVTRTANLNNYLIPECICQNAYHVEGNLRCVATAQENNDCSNNNCGINGTCKVGGYSGSSQKYTCVCDEGYIRSGELESSTCVELCYSSNSCLDNQICDINKNYCISSK